MQIWSDSGIVYSSTVQSLCQCTVECDPLSRDLGKSRPCATGHQAARQCPARTVLAHSRAEPRLGKFGEFGHLQLPPLVCEPLANMVQDTGIYFAGKLHLLRRNPDTKSKLMLLSGHSRAECVSAIL